MKAVIANPYENLTIRLLKKIFARYTDTDGKEINFR